MNTLNSTRGAVLFIDILGTGALTTGKINIDDGTYTGWGIIENKSHQMLAATILVQFRENLNKIKEKYPKIKIAQLSDGAFIWSETLKDFICASHELMMLNIACGVFCRGGMAYGGIITSDAPLSFGPFVVGDAVTKAVNLESIGKGAKIFIDMSLIDELNEEFNSCLVSAQFPIITEIRNNLTGETYDEFKWYVIKDLETHLSSSANPQKKQTAIKSCLKVKPELAYEINMALLCKKFNWNKSSTEGKKHFDLFYNAVNT